MFHFMREGHKARLSRFFALNRRKMCSASKKPFTILVEGNIGCGKTTFLNNFKSNENILKIDEPVEEWLNVGGHNLMKNFYLDKKTWAFTLQSYIMLTMINGHNKETDKPVKMMERSIFSGRYVFIENLSNLNMLSKPELSVLDEWFHWLIKKNSVSVDLIVYLRTDPEVAYNRMIERARSNENYQFNHIKKIHQCHEDWLLGKNDFILPAPVLCLNANKDVKAIRNEYSCFEKQMKIY